MIDIFSKYATAIALSGKTPEHFIEALKRIFHQMGGAPNIIMSDEEGSLQSKLIDDFFKKENITYIINRNHSRFIERFIRTLKNLMNRRLQRRPDEKWYDLLFEALLTYNYKMVHSSTGLTPAEARKHKNNITAKLNMESKAMHDRNYPEIKEEDKVRIFKTNS